MALNTNDYAVKDIGLADFGRKEMGMAEIEDLGRLVKRLRNDFGPIYGLVNNAAIGFDGALALMRT